MSRKSEHSFSTRVVVCSATASQPLSILRLKASLRYRNVLSSSDLTCLRALAEAVDVSRAHGERSSSIQVQIGRRLKTCQTFREMRRLRLHCRCAHFSRESAQNVERTTSELSLWVCRIVEAFGELSKKPWPSVKDTRRIVVHLYLRCMRPRLQREDLYIRSTPEDNKNNSQQLTLNPKPQTLTPKP